MNNRNWINSFSGLKVITIWLIFLMHSGIDFAELNIAKRGVELFFVISGFLAYYTYKKDLEKPSWNESVSLVKKRLVSIIPLYTITFFYYALISKTNVLIMIVNFFMIQAWSGNEAVYFSLNGPTWYLSALLFCYFIFPILAYYNKKSNKPILLFLAISIVRLVMEYMILDGNIFNVSVHTFPVIRSCDFMLGMIVAKIYEENCCKFHKSKIIFTMVEIFDIILIVVLDVLCGKILPRTFFVVLLAVSIFIFAFDAGFISKFLSLRIFQILSKIQLPFYILHAAVTSFIYRVLKLMNLDDNINKYFILFISIVVLLLSCFIYNYLLKEKIERFVKKFLKI